MKDDNKFNIDLKVKANAEMKLHASKEGANKFYKMIGFALVLYVSLNGLSMLITAIAPNGLL